jgi:guanine deaminase
MDQFMALAIAEARQGIEKGDGGPFGAVIVKDGKVVGKGHNEVLKNHDATCHGEMMAIRDASKNLGTFDLSGCVLYTTGYPCPMCLGAILWANIAQVRYGCDVKDAERIGFRDSAFYEIMENGSQSGFLSEIGRSECQRLFDDYFHLPTRKNY